MLLLILFAGLFLISWIISHIKSFSWKLDYYMGSAIKYILLGQDKHDDKIKNYYLQEALYYVEQVIKKNREITDSGVDENNSITIEFVVSKLNINNEQIIEILNLIRIHSLGQNNALLSIKSELQNYIKQNSLSKKNSSNFTGYFITKAFICVAILSIAAIYFVRNI